jgi:hypothetical protein
MSRAKLPWRDFLLSTESAECKEQTGGSLSQKYGRYRSSMALSLKYRGFR